MQTRSLLFLILFSFTTSITFSQELSQTIKGQIIDATTTAPLPFATIIIMGSDPIQGATSDIDGHFSIKNIPIGRYDLKISFIGYETAIKPEVVVTSAKEVVLSIGLRENTTALDEITIRPRIVKETALNTMATVSARMLSVEEANRYAGGFDDPARLAASFPGVASSTGNNAIVIRGNAPKYLQWKIEGVEIPNPNHFANLGAFGGGGLTALSSKLLANSDFFTGAFPAEYNNALSGVFDINMRTGNTSRFEHSIELGTIGLDFGSEGPLNRKNNASYLVNYRYSTLGLISPLLPEEAQGTTYQDLSFKLKLPSPTMGLFSLWGIALFDTSGTLPEKDPVERQYHQDSEKQQVDQYMTAFGLNHRLVLKKSGYLKSTVAFSTDGIDLSTDKLNTLAHLRAENEIGNTNYNLTFKTLLTKKFSPRHTHTSGASVRILGYDFNLKEAHSMNNTLSSLVSEKGNSALISAFSSSSFYFKHWQLNAGLTAQRFTLNGQTTLEPRIGLSYPVYEDHKISFGYGLHSRLEPLNIYFAQTTTSTRDNQGLDFSKAHHFVFAYDRKIDEHRHLKIEPYLQYLFHIPVIANSSSSLLNLQNDWFINDAYVNEGKGKNYGLDLSYEQYMKEGFYYLLSTSVFDSRFTTDDEQWYNTRFNKNYLFNALVGKEFKVGPERQRVLGVNYRMNIQGGDRYSHIDHEASMTAQEVVHNEERPFTERTRTGVISHITINYEWYRKKSTHKLSLKVLNATNHKEYQGHRYNIRSNQVEEFREALMIPNISYRISF